MTDLKNKTILVTGASSGIGRATALLCDEVGANLMLTGRNKEELLNTQKLLKNDSTIIVADLSNENELLHLIAQIPSLDGFVHCAGIIKPLPIKFIKPKNITEIFTVNFNAAVLLCSGLLSAKKLNNNASVVFISSVSAQHPYAGGALYTSSKAALEAFCRAFALENASKKIRANTIAPALVKTKMLEQTIENFSSEELNRLENQYPLGFGEPSDVANIAVFLLSEAAKWITGTTITADGGLLLNTKK